MEAILALLPTNPWFKFPAMVVTLASLASALQGSLNFVPLIVLLLIACWVKWADFGHARLIASGLDQQGLDFVRMRRLWRYSHERDLIHAHTRGGGKYYHVTARRGDVLINQVWIIEEFKARIVEGMPVHANCP